MQKEPGKNALKKVQFPINETLKVLAPCKIKVGPLRYVDGFILKDSNGNEYVATIDPKPNKNEHVANNGLIY